MSYSHGQVITRADYNALAGQTGTAGSLSTGLLFTNIVTSPGSDYTVVGVTSPENAVIVRKTSGVGSWSSGFNSNLTEVSVCAIEFQFEGQYGAGNGDAMCGLSNGAASRDGGYPSIEFAFHNSEGRTPYIFESNSAVWSGGVGSVGPDTKYAIKYDGKHVRYYIDGVLIRTVARTGTLGLDGSIYYPGANLGIKNLRYTRDSGGTTLMTAGSIWGVGYGDRGYGQSSPALVNVSAGNPVGQGYPNLRSVIANLCSWQNTSTSLLPSSGAVSAGAVISAYPVNETPSFPDIIPLVDTNRFNYQVGNMTLTSSAASTTRSTKWGFTPNLTERVLGGGGGVTGTNGSYTIHKGTGAGSGWHLIAYTPEVFGTFRVDWRCDTSNHTMIGLIPQPNAYETPWEQPSSFFIYNDWFNGPAVRCYESNTNPATFMGAWTTSDIFTITYDGSNVRYYVNGALQRTTAYSAGPLGLAISQYYDYGQYPANVFGLGYTPDVSGNLAPAFIQGGFQVDFASEDAARYFFNTGGEIRVAFAHPNTSTSQDSNWNSTLSNLNIAFRANSSAKLSGNGTTTTNVGYYQLTTDWQVIHTVDGSGAYSSNIMQVYAKALSISGSNGAKGYQIQFFANFYDNHDSNYYDVVNSGTVMTLSHLRATASPLTTAIAAPTCSVAQALG